MAAFGCLTGAIGLLVGLAITGLSSTWHGPVLIAAALGCLIASRFDQ